MRRPWPIYEWAIQCGDKLYREIQITTIKAISISFENEIFQ